MAFLFVFVYRWKRVLVLSTRRFNIQRSARRFPPFFSQIFSYSFLYFYNFSGKRGSIANMTYKYQKPVLSCVSCFVLGFFRQFAFDWRAFGSEHQTQLFHVAQIDQANRGSVNRYPIRRCDRTLNIVITSCTNRETPISVSHSLREFAW